jgi:hypothetical protein
VVKTRPSFRVAVTVPESPPLTEQLKGVFEGEKIFKVHSLTAGLFGTFLVLAPSLIGYGNQVLEQAYSSWGIFILAVSYLTYSAPTLDSSAQQLLARTFAIMVAAETLLYTKDLLFRLPGILLSPSDLLLTGGSLAVFTGLGEHVYVCI